MPQNLAPPWDFAGPFGSVAGNNVGVPPEWMIHSITIQRAPTGLAGEDDAGGRISADDSGATITAVNIQCLVVDITTAEGGPENEEVRLVSTREYEIYTATDLTGLCRVADMVAYNGRQLNVTSVQNVDEQFVLWKIHATEYPVK